MLLGLDQRRLLSPQRREIIFVREGGKLLTVGSSTSSPGGDEGTHTLLPLGISPPCGRNEAPPQENLCEANIALLLLSQKTEIYSVELNGTKDVEPADQRDDKKFKGAKNKDSEPNKNHEKEELKKELDLVSLLKAKESGAPSPENLLL